MENIPRVLAGRYEVGEIIGRGGMAEVYVGRDTRLSRTVAIKVLRSDLSDDPTFHARFHREAQSAAALNHPAIVAVYDTGEETVRNSAGKEVRFPFIVMEYVEGHTVRELLKDGAAVPIDEAAEIVVGILGALEYAHNEGIVHRDIKPGNVMLTPTGQVKVMDFGIARALADQSATVTQANSVVGTAQYLSPEQARGETVDTRSDLYSTGCVLFELLTGRPPFVGESAVSVAYQHVREMPPTPSSIASDIPDSLDRVTMKALAKDKNERYSDAGAFRSDLLTVLHGGRVSAPATTAWMAAAAPVAATQIVSPPPPANSATGTMTASAPLDDPDEPGSRWWIWVLLGIAIVAGAIAWWVWSNQDDAAALTVPPLVGMTEAEARETLTGLNLQMALAEERVPDAEIPEGSVVSSNPDEGAPIEEGGLVTVTLSSGAEKVPVPNLEGMTEAEALRELQANDLVGITATERVPHEDIEEGSVVSSNPPADEMVDIGSEVEITLSDGPGSFELPDLTGMTEAEARAELTRLELEFSGQTLEDAPRFDQNEVVSTNPAAGATVKKGDGVTLTIATGSVNVPDVTGETEADALDMLQREYGFTVTIEREYSNDQPSGYVAGQTPQSGLVRGGSTVTIVVSRGEEPVPDPEPEPDQGGGEDG
ncbi:MAG: Stk1 family PASTA domain-containing Ser/Thr kinase [Ruaniaceae bacterium]|nr:Stk1 family PASTA domain-containing Ser/Thr kinase [Ruaniaceae bacterium]